MRTELLTKALREEGIYAEPENTVKNGVSRKGLRLRTVGEENNEGLFPIIYPGPTEPVKEFVCRAKRALDNLPDIDRTEIFNKRYVRENVFVAVQKKGQQNVLKRDLMNLEMVVRLQVTPEATMVIPDWFPESVDMDPEEIWDCAMRNSDEFDVQSMAYMLGIPIVDDVNLFVVTSRKHPCFGAAALAYLNVFEKAALAIGCDRVYILPSSTQELILVPDSDFNPDTITMAGMVKDINASQVAPEIQLEAAVYIYDLERGCIEIAEAVI